MMTTNTMKETVKVVEVSRVSPPPHSVPNTSLPLTFLDVFWIFIPPVQRLFFYDYSDLSNTTQFLNSDLPHLKRSLSLALQHFYPLAGTLTLSPETHDQEIRCVDGDSVPLTIAESGSDFHRLVSDQPKDVSESHPLVPQLAPQDLLALQVTIFPNAGLCIGVSVQHVVADGRSFIHFMRSWASICRSRSDILAISSIPIYNRTLIQDNNNHLKRLLLEQLESYKPDKCLETLSVAAQADAVRATFVLSRAHIERLRQRRGHVQPHCSSFVLACAHVWTCLAKARGVLSDKWEFFGFAADCRTRLDPALPETYFGNCIGGSIATAKSSDLGGEEGLLVATEAIRKEIAEMGEGVLKDAETWIPRSSALVKERVVSVAGSPKFRVYDTDFGWGRPRKVEIVSIEGTGAISLAESRNGDGGIEVGLALLKPEMDRFASAFEEGLTSTLA
ncbi:hypothetical protein AAC387_Pa11g2227 [Persea americana]